MPLISLIGKNAVDHFYTFRTRTHPRSELNKYRDSQRVCWLSRSAMRAMVFCRLLLPEKVCKQFWRIIHINTRTYTGIAGALLLFVQQGKFPRLYRLKLKGHFWTKYFLVYLERENMRAYVEGKYCTTQ